MKDDKKKVMVLAVLGVVIVCVGAFQILNSGSSAPVPAKAEAKKSTSDETSADSVAEQSSANDSAYAADSAKPDDPLRQLYSIKLAARDPFTQLELPPLAEGATTPTPPKTNPEPSRKGSFGGPKVPPMPVPGDFSMGGPLNNGGVPPMGDNIVPMGPQYSASGVIRGEKNMAVISDANGNQRLVREGQELDGDTRVQSISKGKVVLRKKDGKSITLNVGGNP